ncbi:hypothetical protein C8A01DRAFT_40955 [Parachaetomium inaequale]|uniref:Uncharacterized protein n=1 Tax=Parachaetomium inaequale TaxID=2588326 RepID=A0AAN6SM18_9PEZI|nr:hypothetical protein C8A01DRAFT_40955 [Parachaetomium inaequale]
MDQDSFPEEGAKQTAATFSASSQAKAVQEAEEALGAWFSGERELTDEEFDKYGDVIFNSLPADDPSSETPIEEASQAGYAGGAHDATEDGQPSEASSTSPHAASPTGTPSTATPSTATPSTATPSAATPSPTPPDLAALGREGDRYKIVPMPSLNPRPVRPKYRVIRDRHTNVPLAVYQPKTGLINLWRLVQPVGVDRSRFQKIRYRIPLHEREGKHGGALVAGTWVKFDVALRVVDQHKLPPELKEVVLLAREDCDCELGVAGPAQPGVAGSSNQAA